MLGGAFRLANPALLGLLALVPACWLLVRQRNRRRSPGALLISTLRPLADVPVSWRVRSRWVLTALQLLVAVLLVLALARPQVGQASTSVPAQGIDIVLCLDVSGSMLDPGLSAPSKLEGAKQALIRFISQRTNNRVGFVLFESESRVMSPLTLDYHALEQIVSKANNGLLPDGTAIGYGIADAVNLLRDSRAKSRVIILATDGENNSGSVGPDQAAQIAAQLHMKLYTIGMFAQGETPQTTQIEEKAMQQWATSTGGFYGRAQSERQLQQIFDTISQLETSQVERLHYTHYIELAGDLLVPAAGLLLLEVGLGATLLRRVP
jgi:Ca-activated chloride channel family protein